MINCYHKTERELIAELERLKKLIEAGEATPVDARDISDVRIALAKIDAAKRAAVDDVPRRIPQQTNS